ncbi:DNA adenine methylase [Mesorhizobium sp. M0045]|uniref:DNA adenine methylase n=1 Tax=Mesorhizobium sp. M0045 TaxID=2956857 RepID=UPI00333C8C7D
MAVTDCSSPSRRRLTHFTPLRYPGGKGKLAAYVKEILSHNNLLDGCYIEPYAGGAAIALELLMQEYVSRICINDYSKPIYSFWKCVLDETDDLCRLIRDTPLTLESWLKQKSIFKNQKEQDDLNLGFATFFLNRTNRSGILNGGIIGGRDQSGPWKIDARFNRMELVYRIESIAKMRSRISLSRLDALEFLKTGLSIWPTKTLIYLDPPYYVKGRDLYYDFYQPKDHQELASFIIERMSQHRWIVSYDNAPQIRNFYSKSTRLTYELGYSARQSSPAGVEVMFFSELLKVPNLVGPFRVVADNA